MKRNRLLAFGLMVSIAALTACGGSNSEDSASMTESIAPTIELEDFFKNPERTSYQISPDGSHYSYLAPYENRRNIFVENIETGETKRITSQTDRDIAGYFWANNEQLIFMRDDGGDEFWYLVATDVSSGEEKVLTKADSVRTQIIDDLEDIPNEMIIGLNKRNPQVFDPYRLNLETGEMTMVAENPGNITGWMTDHDGKLRIAFVTDGVNQSIMHRATEEDDWANVITTNFKQSVSPRFFTFDNQNIYATSNVGRDKEAAIILDLSNGEEIEVLYENETNDVSGLMYSRKDKKIIGASYYTDKAGRHYFDEASKARYDRLTKELEGYEVAITGYTKAEDKFMVRTYSDRSLGDYYLYDDSTDELKHLANVSPWINEDDMASMKPISYKSRDGLTIHGYLTLPKGMENAKNLPVVVNVHGGPWARDRWGFNPEVQFLANRGYAVLQMNFRGSTSYGREFWEASFDQWGLSMQEDVQDGALWLVEQGIADPARLAIYGGSYGGYATLQGLVKDPDFYACGVDYVGVSNLFTFMNGIPPYWKPYLEMMYEMVGDPTDAEDSTRMASTSPALNADKITAPLFVAQGANDPRVVKSESDQMVDAMKSRGIEVQYMVKDDEGHGFRNEENKFDFYRAMESFLGEHIGTVEAEEAATEETASH
ncbi:MAG: S9 family peptidase [Flavobacteriales bacterium]|nr:S9 family peptidase [Flavobacteriales bacterium]MBT4931071.1 S9 family peptidase [Flavobacteriales bacterium]MBT6131688.1 S9 family peptidase [Flavobacteriales bacterium]MBT6382362.1 S9 family peptidase [Flavobacteriales bacterium]MBT6978569.1 S9 family peptidase [Flavobacteriales bacterium]